MEEGRGVFDNLRRFIAWTVPTNIGEGMVILVAVLLGTTLPIVPVQILWINMTTAVFLGLTMAFEPKERGIMRRPPRPPDQPLMTRTLVWRTWLVSVLVVVAATVRERSIRPPRTCTGSPRRPDTESRVEARIDRHAVLRVQARSVSPGA